MHELLTSADCDLTHREKLVLTARFGLDGAAERTLEEIARPFAVTRERIRKIEVQALRKLRRGDQLRRPAPPQRQP